MNRRLRTLFTLLGCTLGAVTTPSLVGCAGTTREASAPSTNAKASGKEPKEAAPVGDDGALCDFQTRKDVEVSETVGPGAIQPNIRRVFRVLGTGSDRRKVLTCREVDTNLDGLKDVVRLYNDDGQSKEERADTNFDGKIDTWNKFSKGRLTSVEIDRNADGKADEWKTYVEGKLIRIKRDENFDEHPDVWEMYRDGRLERMGVDLTPTDGEERVSRWDRDVEWQRQMTQEAQRREQEARKKREEEIRAQLKAAEEAAEKEGSADGSGGDSKKKPAPAPKPAVDKKKNGKSTGKPDASTK